MSPFIASKTPLKINTPNATTPAAKARLRKSGPKPPTGVLSITSDIDTYPDYLFFTAQILFKSEPHPKQYTCIHV